MQKSPSCSSGTFWRGLSAVYSVVLVSPVRGPIGLVLYARFSSYIAQCARKVRLVPTPQRVRSGTAAISPFLHGRPQIQFMSPAIFALMVREPVRIGDRGGPGQTVGRDFRGIDAGRGLHALMDRLAVDAGVDQQMDNVNIPWSELARHRLGHGAQAELCRRKCRKPLAAANAGGGARKQDGAAAS